MLSSITRSESVLEHIRWRKQELGLSLDCLVSKILGECTNCVTLLIITNTAFLVNNTVSLCGKLKPALGAAGEPWQ